MHGQVLGERCKQGKVNKAMSMAYLLWLELVCALCISLPSPSRMVLIRKTEVQLLGRENPFINSYTAPPYAARDVCVVEYAHA